MAADVRVRRIYDDPVPGKGQFTQPGSSYFAATGSLPEAAPGLPEIKSAWRLKQLAVGSGGLRGHTGCGVAGRGAVTGPCAWVPRPVS